MTETLPVQISRDGLHELSVPAEIRVTGAFDIGVTNHGESVHLHVHLEDALADVASVPATNHFLEADDRRSIPVEMAPPESTFRGKVKLVSAHGSCTRYVDVVVEPPEAAEQTVRVDESLAHPQERPPTPSPAVAAVDDPRTLAALASALVLVVGVVVAVLANSLVVTVGVLFVLVAVLGAIAWTAR
ncbi:DUF7524 family protein [Halococcoides cellulosivorans]|uniref:Uncharacterized protein n=1 Tax=Halococcoides cellulosivorans TaxID=1679096 RepID=A0A2R4WXW7_9EURY|nr:hypothetical protein [Halococcoides cellulosivorans]AWB26384.1 hypothetical protein HARCEL1_00935 [Halococcoides cellulosivorans]